MRYLLVLVSLFLSVTVAAQNKIDKKEKRRIEKEKQMVALGKNYQSTISFVEGKRFVLEAEYLQGTQGTRVTVNSALNFIYVDSAKIIIQVGNGYSYGYNSVGGVTIEGTITSWSLKKNDKRKSLFLNISVMSNLGIYHITMDIMAERHTVAVITSITSGRLEYTGKIVSIDKARIYKARSN